MGWITPVRLVIKLWTWFIAYVALYSLYTKCGYSFLYYSFKLGNMCTFLGFDIDRANIIPLFCVLIDKVATYLLFVIFVFFFTLYIKTYQQVLCIDYFLNAVKELQTNSNHIKKKLHQISQN